MFSARRIFIVRKVSDLWAGTARNHREPYRESKEPSKRQDSGFTPKKFESTARNVLEIVVMEEPIAC